MSLPPRSLNLSFLVFQQRLPERAWPALLFGLAMAVSHRLDWWRIKPLRSDREGRTGDQSKPDCGYDGSHGFGSHSLGLLGHRSLLRFEVADRRTVAMLWQGWVLPWVNCSDGGQRCGVLFALLRSALPVPHSARTSESGPRSRSRG